MERSREHKHHTFYATLGKTQSRSDEKEKTGCISIVLSRVTISSKEELHMEL